MNAIRTLASLLAAATLVAGCATPVVRSPTTTVILLPDEDGHVGAVSVSSSGGTQRISEAYNASTVTGANGRPSAADAMTQTDVDATFAGLLKAQPQKPISFTLHFVLDRTTLTEESRAMIPAVMAAVRERKPTEISVFGHTDAIGSEKHNDKLSADRARAVAQLLTKDDPALDIQQQSFGDKLPLFNPGSKVEPRNRRVEIQIL